MYSVTFNKDIARLFKRSYKTMDKDIQKRSCRAIRCLPLNSFFYQVIQKKGLTARKVFIDKDRYISNGFIWFKSSDQVERSFCWLIIIGILRREVDGQGLTAKVRITPLGKEILGKYPQLPNQKPTYQEKMKNWALRKILN